MAAAAAAAAPAPLVCWELVCALNVALPETAIIETADETITLKLQSDDAVFVSGRHHEQNVCIGVGDSAVRGAAAFNMLEKLYRSRGVRCNIRLVFSVARTLSVRGRGARVSLRDA